MFCSNCGLPINTTSKFCPKCGVAINNIGAYPQGDEKSIAKKTYYVSSKNRMIAFILGALGFFGFAGLHRFYVGKLLTGFLYFISFGGFFIGTIYDLCTIYAETFTDRDGFPLYSDESMKSNYKRRTPSPESNLPIVILAIIVSFFCILGFIGAIASIASNNIDQKSNGYVETANQNKNTNPSTNSKERKEKKYKVGPITDIPMTGTPIENITETVKQNTDGSMDMVKLSNVKVDVSNGEADVLIVLQGAKGLTAQGTLDEFNRVIKQELASLYQVQPGIKISNVTVNVYMKVTYSGSGAEDNLLTYKVSMDKNTASQMHWENYKSIDIMSAATDVAMSPSFKKLLDRNAGKSVLDESLETLGF